MVIFIPTEDGGQTITGPPVTIETDSITFQPGYVENVSTEISGNVDSETEMCGRTEHQKNGDGNWKVTIEGIVSDSNLNKVHTLSRGQRVTVHAEVLGDRGGEFIVSDTTVQHLDGLNAFEEPVSGEGSPSPDSRENAYEFQFQLQEPGAEE